MAMVLKLANTAQELNDVYWLRHEVYVKEQGKFGGIPLHGEHIVDKYDTIPRVGNVIAYDKGEPVGTMRVNLDTGGGLPSEEYYSFDDYRKNCDEQCARDGKEPAIYCSAGMLAVRKGWYGRRDVVFSLIKMGIGALHSWGATHMVATVNYKTVSMYGRMGFTELANSIWVEELCDQVVPIAAPLEDVYQWTFTGLFDDEKLESFWLDTFCGVFERVLLSPNEQIFREGDDSLYAYIIDRGWVTISRQDPEGNEFTHATLPRGALVGELTLIDEGPRSATATATTNVELIRLGRENFYAGLREDPGRVDKLLYLLAGRIRRAGDLIMTVAFAPQTGRVKFALESLRASSIRDRKCPDVSVIKVGPGDIAKSAGVREHEVRRVLEMERQEGRIEFGENIIRFLK